MRAAVVGRVAAQAVLFALGAIALTGCFRGSKTPLTRAVDEAYPCAESRYEVQRIDAGRGRLFRVRACAQTESTHLARGIFQCSRRRCLSLTETARAHGANDLACAPSDVRVEERRIPGAFIVSGCGNTLFYTCTMRHQVADCVVVQPPMAPLSLRQRR